MPLFRQQRMNTSVHYFFATSTASAKHLEYALETNIIKGNPNYYLEAFTISLKEKETPPTMLLLLNKIHSPGYNPYLDDIARET